MSIPAPIINNILFFSARGLQVGTNTVYDVDTKTNIIISHITRLVMNLVSGNPEEAKKDSNLGFNILRILLARDDFSACFGVKGAVWELIRNAEEFASSASFVAFIAVKVAHDTAERLTRWCC
jgi:hypothetical protein